MNPQLPKVEIGPLKGEMEEIPGATPEQGNQKGVESPSGDAAEILRVSGSVGVEAGLTDFEAVSDNGASADNSSADDDADQTREETVFSSAAKPAVGVNVVSQTPVVAEDKDDIEREWVSKAKRVVEQTKSDPYLQRRAVSRLSVDYNKKRFGKDIKLPDGEG